jgi:hypothetical protein
VRIHADRDYRALRPGITHQFLDAWLPSSEATNFPAFRQEHEALKVTEAIVSDAEHLAGKAEAVFLLPLTWVREDDAAG